MQLGLSSVRTAFERQTSDRRSIAQPGNASAEAFLLAPRMAHEDDLIAVYQQYGRLVYSVAYRVLENPQDAEEVTQDVFMRVWEKREAFNPARGSWVSWLATLARNAAVDRLRHEHRRVPQQTLFSEDDPPLLWESWTSENTQDDLRRTVAAAINHLSTEHQQALQLAYFYQMSQTEIAAHLNRPLGTIKSHLRQAMERLKGIWLAGEAHERG